MIPTDWLRHRSISRAEVVALRDEDGRQLDYADLYARAAAAASELSGRGRSVVLELEPGLEHAVAMHAAILSGLPFQTLRPGLPEPERTAALAGLRDPVAFDPAWLTEREAGAPAPAAPGPPEENVLCHVLTSGTSGVRTSVGLTVANHYASAAASAYNLGVEPSDRWLCCMPVDHIGGLSILIRSVIYGTGAIIHPRFDPERVARELGMGASVVSLVPTQLRRLLAEGAPIERPRLLLVGGGPLERSVLDEALARGANVVQTYGLTEACSQVCALPAADAPRKRGSVGRALLGVQVETATGGEILVSGPTVAAGAAGADGRLRTGDLGRLDPEGYLWVEGRADDLIVTGGENVAPEEVERALLLHPAVADAAVIGREDPEWGSAVTAVVVVADGHGVDPGELIEHCRTRLAAHKLPKRIEFVASLPRTETGKLRRRGLR
jgi:O-succinylbenzoic acid--CoA ligase